MPEQHDTNSIIQSYLKGKISWREAAAAFGIYSFDAFEALLAEQGIPNISVRVRNEEEQ